MSEGGFYAVILCIESVVEGKKEMNIVKKEAETKHKVVVEEK